MKPLRLVLKSIANVYILFHIKEAYAKNVVDICDIVVI